MFQISNSLVETLTSPYFYTESIYRLKFFVCCIFDSENEISVHTNDEWGNIIEVWYLSIWKTLCYNTCVFVFLNIEQISDPRIWTTFKSVESFFSIVMLKRSPNNSIVFLFAQAARTKFWWSYLMKVKWCPHTTIKH